MTTNTSSATRAAGTPLLVKPHVPRDQLLAVLAQLPPCVIGMEACTGAHHWARQLIKLGHTPKLMAPRLATHAAKRHSLIAGPN